VRRLLAPVMLLLGVLGAAPAAAQVVTLRPSPGPSLGEGPVLVGERVAWAQLGCLRGCGALEFDGETDSLYEVRTAGDGAARTLFRARKVRASSGPRFFGHTFSFLVSEGALVTRRLTSTSDETGDETSRWVVRAGAPGTQRPVLVNCWVDDYAREAPAALDGNRLAYDPDPCDAVPRLVVRDLGTGTTTALPEPAGGGLLDMRGRFVAWTATSAGDPRLVVHDLDTGTTAYTAPNPGVTALDLDADGTVAAVTGKPRRLCSSGRLFRYSVAAPAPEELNVPACATVGVRIERGRIFFLGWDGPTRTLRELSPDGAVRDVVRFNRVAPWGFDVSGEHVAWAARDCAGDQAIFTSGLSAPPSDMGSSDCRARFGPGVAPVRSGVATVRLRCPRGCYGDLTLRRMGWHSFFSLQPGETDLRVRLRRRARRRLERHGLLETHAVLETYDRAGDRRVRRRALTLVLRR
jgi:hypothetical protein